VLSRDLVLPHLIARNAERAPDRTFIDVVGGGSVTRREFHLEALRWASALEALGVGDGQIIATMLPVSVDAITAWLGAGWLRAQTVLTSTAHRGRMLAYVLRHSGASHLIVSRRYLDRIEQVAGDLPALTTLIVPDDDAPAVSLPIRVVGREELFAGIEPVDREGPGHYDIGAILYTSGTTGPSKGVLTPWAQLHATASSNTAQLYETDAWYSPMPLSHISGISPLYSMAIVGGRLVLKEAFSTTDFLNDITKYHCTAALIVGAMAQFLMNLPASPQDSAIPLRYVGISPTPPFVDEFKERFGVVAYSGYNMTELSMPICWRGATVNSAAYESAGQVRAGYQVRIVDEHDEEVPVGTSGELIVRADEPWTMNAGYLGMPTETAAAWRNGWFHTGDVLRMDEAGNYYFIDRLKDTIRRRGENISSAEVEAEVNEHPAVLESAAVAAPSELGGDEVKIFIVLRPGESLTPADLVEFLVPRMSHYMVPRFVEIVDDLPKTGTFKVRKHELRARGNSSTTWDRQAAGIEVKRAR
jgi:crotonobetaine/carnitine-CoA ligase